VALTNNSNRGVGTNPPADEANPRNANRHGHVVEWEETAGTAGDTFAWRIFLVAGDPTDPSTYFAGYDRTKVSAISCPDNVEFDPAGNLWISTDGSPSALPGTNDGLYAVPTTGADRGLVKRFLTVPFGAECSGPLISRDAKSVFVSVQHPGETTGSTVDTPSSTWPDRSRQRPFPRPSVAVVHREDGGRVGS
jgi:secreted PhoX family phosphatase